MSVTPEQLQCRALVGACRTLGLEAELGEEAMRVRAWDPVAPSVAMELRLRRASAGALWFWWDLRPPTRAGAAAAPLDVARAIALVVSPSGGRLCERPGRR